MSGSSAHLTTTTTIKTEFFPFITLIVSIETLKYATYNRCFRLMKVIDSDPTNDLQ